MEPLVVLGVIAVGLVHGVLPDHGWPIAATYALNKQYRLFYGVLAAVILGVGHLISSVVLVLAYFWFATVAEFAESRWMGIVAGSILILLGIHEYRNGGHGHVHGDHGHDHDGAHESHGHDDSDHAHAHEESHDGYGHGHDHSHDGHGHGHDHSHDGHGHGDPGHHDHEAGHHEHDRDHEHTDDHGDGLLARLRSMLPGGGHQHLRQEHADRGLLALGVTALLLGFAHEEPIQILAICAGTDACLELMLIYSLAVIVAIVAPTLALIAGYEHHRERIERLTPYLPTITAIALVGMGLAFVFGLI